MAQEQSRIYEALVEEMSEGAATLSAEGTVLYCNRRLAEMMGSAAGASFASFVAPSGQAAFAGLFARARAGRVQGPVTCRCRDGPRLLQLSLNGLGDGAVALVAAEAQPALLLDATAEGLFATDREGRCTFANRACLRLLGYRNLEAVLGRDIHSVLQHGRAGQTCTGAPDCRMRRTIRTGEAIHADDEIFRRADGTTFPVEYWSQPVDHAGEAIGAVVTFLDISGRQQAEKYLTRSEERYRRLVNHLPDVIWTTDRDGRTSYASPNAAGTFGYTAEEICAHGLELRSSRIHPEDRAAVSEAFAALFRQERSLDIEYRYQRPDGRWIWIQDRAVRTFEYRGTRWADVASSEITARKNMEAALRESEGRYRNLFERNLAGVFRVDSQNQFLDCSPTCATILGYDSPQELLQQGSGDVFYDPADRQALVDRLIEERSLNAVELRLKRKDGSAIWVLENINLVEGDSGHPDVIEGTFIDITERKATEAALQKAQRETEIRNRIADVFLTTAGEAAFGAILAIVLEAMQSRFGLFGYLDEEGALVCPSLTREVWDMCRLGDKTLRFPRPSWGGLWGRALVEQRALYANEDLRFPQGHVPLRRALAAPILLQNQLIGLLAAADKAEDYTDSDRQALERIARYIAPVLHARLQRDIQEAARRRAEEALAASEARFRSMVEDTWEVIFLIDAEGSICYLSSTVSRVLGYSEQEAMGQSIFRMMHRDHVSAGRQLLARALATPNVPVVGECQYRRRDGVWRWFEYTIRNLLHNPAVHALVVISRDCTERVERAAQLQRATKAAEAATRAKSEFLANMSHEIRTPMNGILGMTELALATPLTVEQKEYLTMIKASGDALLVVINDILDFSKIEAGKLDLENVEFEVVETLAPALKALGLDAWRKGLEVNFQVPPDMPAFLIGDPNRLRQVVVNLVGNAIKFTERGEVNVRLSSEAGGEGIHWLGFSVQDTGIGIPPEKQATIFEAFSQVDSSVARRHGGTGLGLSISRRLVEMMGGRLWLESVEGKGSTFHFHVPLREGPARGQAPAAEVELTGLGVLVVDDNLTNRRILEEVLRSWSMHPTLAADGHSALGDLERAWAAGHPYALVLVDANMPEMDGFSFIERTRQDSRLAGLRIILMTSAGQPGEATRCRELGVAAFLIKPVAQTELRRAVLGALGGARPAAETAPAVLRAAPPARRLRVLLAEDNAVNQTVVRRLLEKQGHQLEVAANGREALERFSRGGFDLVLMDVQMPEMDGLEAAAAIRKLEQPCGGHVPIIALTAHAMKSDLDRCLAAGMDGYLSKPVRVEDLLRQIEQASRR